jgi:MFS family permease
MAVMMFLQYAIWGAWMPVLSGYLLDAGFSGKMVGLIYCLLPLGILFSPVTGGQLADRLVPLQWLLVVANLIGAVVLYYAAGIDYKAIAATDPNRAFWVLTGLLFAFSAVFGPTIPLTNALCFRHLTNIERDFGKIRVWGTIGWIAAGLVLTAWRTETARQAAAAVAAATPEAAQVVYRAWNAIWGPLSGGLGTAMIKILGPAGPRDMLLLSAAFSALMAVFCVVLPHTPPKREGVDPLAFVKAFRMLRDRNFAIFMAISFIVTTELWFYYILTAPFLSGPVGVKAANVPALMTTGQIGEIITLLVLLPILLPRLGVRLCLALGVIAWPIRYAVFALGQPWWLVAASLPLHGFCYVFFFVVGQIYSDNVAPRDIRASAQSLWAVFVLGIGSIVGSYLAGWIQQVFTVDKVTNWTAVFSVPLAVTVICALAFLVFFREPQTKQMNEEPAGT